MDEDLAGSSEPCALRSVPMYDDIFARLLPLLQRLEGVAQDPRFHPEGDALYHSLQVFSFATRESDEPRLLAAALFTADRVCAVHDLGKAAAGDDHAAAGAALLEGIAQPSVCWLVTHHLDLLKRGRETRQRLHDDPRLRELEQLRAWDLKGRERHVHVPDVERALGAILEPGRAEGWLAESNVLDDET